MVLKGLIIHFRYIYIYIKPCAEHMEVTPSLGEMSHSRVEKAEFSVGIEQSVTLITTTTDNLILSCPDIENERHVEFLNPLKLTIFNQAPSSPKDKNHQRHSFIFLISIYCHYNRR